MMNLLTIKSAFKESIPVMMGYLVLGFAFGMLLVSKGFPIYYAFIMSRFIYAGSMQFVTISLLAGQASFISSFIMTLMVNARHLVYGLSMLKKFNFLGKLKPYMIFSLTDETFSLLVKNDFKSKNEVFLISFLDQCYWIIGSLVGATIGNNVSFNTQGLEFSMTALFIVIVINQIKNNSNHLATLIGFFVSIICLIIFGSDNFVIFSMILIMIILILVKPRLKNE